MEKSILILLTAVLICCAGPYMVETWIGDRSGGDSDGSRAQARVRRPCGMCRSADGTFYIADSGNNKVKKVSPDGTVTTIGGAGQFSTPFNVAVDADGNVYVGNFGGNNVRRISPSGTVTTIAGSGQRGLADGAGASAQFSSPRGVAVDADGNVYVGDSWNHRIRKIDQSNGNMVSTFAGGGPTGTSSTGSVVDATGGDARFFTPSGLSIGPDGSIYVGDAFNHRIRRIDTEAHVTTAAGTGPSGDGNGGFLDGDVSEARLNTPTESFCTDNGTLLIGDTFNNRVRMVTSDGMVSTIGGTGEAGFRDGADSVSQFNYPRGIVANAHADSIFVADYNNNLIRLIWNTDVTSTRNKPATGPLTGKRRRDGPCTGGSISELIAGGAQAVRIYGVDGRMVWSLPGRYGNGALSRAVRRPKLPAGVCVARIEGLHRMESVTLFTAERE